MMIVEHGPLTDHERDMARAWARDIASATPLTEDDARLLVSEIQVNAIRHGKNGFLERYTLPDGTLVVRSEDVKVKDEPTEVACEAYDWHGGNIIREIVREVQGIHDIFEENGEVVSITIIPTAKSA